jgi:PAS domain S-box-containing protein
MPSHPVTPLVPQWSAEVLPALLEASGIIIAVLDRDGRVRSIDAHAATLLGREHRTLMGAHWSELTHAQDGARPGAKLDALWRTPGVHGPMIGRARRADGSNLWLESVVDSRDTASRGLVILSRDVTARLEDDDRLRASLAEAQRFEALGRLAGGVAHDLNNLLTVITGYATLLSGRLPSGSHDQQEAEEVRVGAERASELVRQLHRLGASGPREARGADLGEQVDRLADLVRRAIGPAGRFEHHREQAVPLVFDPGTLEQSLLLVAVWLRSEQPEGPWLKLRSSRRILDGPQAERLGVHPGAHAVLELEFTRPQSVTEQPPLVFAAVNGILSRVGGVVEIFALPENNMLMRLHWPLVPASPEEMARRGPHPARRPGGPWRA